MFSNLIKQLFRISRITSYYFEINRVLTHDSIINNMRAIHEDRNFELKPIYVYSTFEPEFWNKKRWDIPLEHKIYLWLWVEDKENRYGQNFTITDVAFVSDIWGKFSDNSFTIELARLDGNLEYAIKVYVFGRLIRLYNKYTVIKLKEKLFKNFK